MGIFYFVSLWPWFDLRIPKCLQVFYKSLSTYRPNLREMAWKTAEKWWNPSRTNFQRLSPRNIDLCSMTMQMQRRTVLSYVYTSAEFHQDRMKNNREIATSGFSILCPCDLGLWHSHPKMYTSLLQIIIYHLVKFEKDWLINGREIV